MRKRIKITSLLLLVLLGISLIPTKLAYAAVSAPTLKKGSSGVEVYALQYLLNNKGYSLSIDGSFGSGTETAVKNFQSKNSLTADGIVGAGTWSKLFVTVKQGDNNNAVKALQYLLKNKYGYSITVDGAFGSGANTAVKNFQSKYALSSDGVVGPATWNQLLASTSTTPTNNFWSSRSSWLHPTKGKWNADPTTGSRNFGSGRDSGARMHAGIDYILPEGTAVYSMTKGKVINVYSFWEGTWAVEVENNDGTIARYCEISSSVKVGQTVERGTKIGTVKTSNQNTAMLHLEVYMGTSTGSLTVRGNTSYNYVNGTKYQRRSDLVDPMGSMNLKKS